MEKDPFSEKNQTL